MYTMYNRPTHEWKALDKLLKDAYENGFDAGRAAGFAAGYAAAQGQPQAKIEEAYQQGIKDAAVLQPVRKNGVGY